MTTGPPAIVSDRINAATGGTEQRDRLRQLILFGTSPGSPLFDLNNDQTWTTAGGAVLPIENLTWQHRSNIVEMLARLVRNKTPWSDYISSATRKLVLVGEPIDSILAKIEPLAAITTVKGLEATPLIRRLNDASETGPPARHRDRVDCSPHSPKWITLHSCQLSAPWPARELVIGRDRRVSE